MHRNRYIYGLVALLAVFAALRLTEPVLASAFASVKVTDLIPGTAATNIAKAEDAGHTTGDTGVPIWGVINLLDAARAGTDGDYAPPSLDATGKLKVANEPSLKSTYVFASALFTPVASTGDVLEIKYGSKLCKVLKLEMCYVNTAAGAGTFTLEQRDSADSGGTPVAQTGAEMDTDNAAVTCTVATFTANPTVNDGSPVRLSQSKIYGVNTSASNPSPSIPYVTLYEYKEGGQAYTLRSGQQLAVTCGGTIPGGTAPQLGFRVTVTEE